MRRALIGAVLAGALLPAGQTLAGPAPRGDVSRCAGRTGDAARACYGRELALQLGTRVAPVATPAPFVCALHAARGGRGA